MTLICFLKLFICGIFLGLFFFFFWQPTHPEQMLWQNELPSPASKGGLSLTLQAVTGFVDADYNGLCIGLICPTQSSALKLGTNPT